MNFLKKFGTLCLAFAVFSCSIKIDRKSDDNEGNGQTPTPLTSPSSDKPTVNDQPPGGSGAGNTNEGASSQPPANGNLSSDPTNISSDKDCLKWDLSSNSDKQAIEAAGIQIKLDCVVINLSGYSNQLEKIRTSLLPSTLREIHGKLTDILALPVVPKNIRLSNLSARALGRDTWHITVTADDPKQEVLNFVERESLFQPREKRLFSGKIFINNRGNIGTKTERVHPEEFAKASEALTRLAPTLLETAEKSGLRIVGLPLGTNETKNLSYLEFSPKAKTLTLPYEAPQAGIEYYLKNVTPQLAAFYAVLSGVNIQFSYDAYILNNELITLSSASAEQPEEMVKTFTLICDREIKSLNDLNILAPKIKSVMTQEKALVLRLLPGDTNNIQLRHTLLGSLLTLYVQGNQDGVFLRPVNSDSLYHCLDTIAARLDTSAACRVQFILNDDH